MSVIELAAEVALLADGMEAAYQDANVDLTVPRKMRCLAREAVRLAGELDAERTARESVQAQRDQALTFLGERAYRQIMRSPT